MTTDHNPAEGNEPRSTSHSFESAAHPLVALSLSTTLATIAGVLTDWNTGALVFLSATALFGSARRTS